MVLPLVFARAVAGDWTGTSLCTTPALPPACHDETVLYHFTPRGENKVHLVADKIVDGKPESMGEFDMTQNGSRLTYEMTNRQGRALWDFTMAAARVSGTLSLLPNGELRTKSEVRKKWRLGRVSPAY